MTTEITKAEAALLIPNPPSPRRAEIEAIRLSAIRARDEAAIGAFGRIAQRAGSAVIHAVEALVSWSTRNATYASLSRLTDRELADIGLTRGDIGHVFDAGFGEAGRGANDNGQRRAA